MLLFGKQAGRPSQDRAFVWLNSSTLSCVPKRNENIYLHKNLYTNINDQEVGITQTSISCWKDTNMFIKWMKELYKIRNNVSNWRRFEWMERWRGAASIFKSSVLSILYIQINAKSETWPMAQQTDYVWCYNPHTLETELVVSLENVEKLFPLKSKNETKQKF